MHHFVLLVALRGGGLPKMYYLVSGESKMLQTDCVNDKEFICKIEHSTFLYKSNTVS